MQMLNRHQSNIDTNTCISADWTKAHINHFGSLSNTIPKSNKPFIEQRLTIYTFTMSHWYSCLSKIMMTSSNGNIFRVTGLCAGNSPVAGEFPYKGQWRGALMFSFICRWINGWVNNLKAGDLWRLRGHYDVTVNISQILVCLITI